MSYAAEYVNLLNRLAESRGRRLSDVARIGGMAQMANAQVWGQLPGQIVDIAGGAYNQYQKSKELEQKQAQDQERNTLASRKLDIDAARQLATEDNYRATQDLATRTAASESERKKREADIAEAQRVIPTIFGVSKDMLKAAATSPEAYRERVGYMRAVNETMHTLSNKAFPLVDLPDDPNDVEYAEIVDGINTILTQYDAAKAMQKPNLMTVTPGSSVLDEADPTKSLFTAPSAPTAPLRPVAVQTREGGQNVTKFVVPTEGASYPSQPPSSSGGASGMGRMYDETDPKVIANEIIEGRQSPIITDLGRGVQGAVSTELGKRKVDLSRMQSEWKSVQRFYLSKQSTQQLRIRQSADVILQSTDAIDQLADQWDAGGFKALNAANLAAAQNGLYGPEATKIATLLQAQLTETVEAMGNVYMGGNTPTDRAMILAQSQLKANWSKDTLMAATDLVRRNTRFRLNAIDNIGPSGIRQDSPYVLQKVETPTDTTTGQKPVATKKPDRLGWRR